MQSGAANRLPSWEHYFQEYYQVPGNVLTLMQLLLRQMHLLNYLLGQSWLRLATIFATVMYGQIEGRSSVVKKREISDHYCKGLEGYERHILFCTGSSIIHVGQARQKKIQFLV